MSGTPVWRAGKKGVHRLQPEVSVLRVCGQVSLVRAAAGLDGAWGSAGAAGLLLLRSLQAEFSPLLRRTGLVGRDQPGADAAGLFGSHVVAICRCGRVRAQAACRRARAGIDRPALHGRGRRVVCGRNRKRGGWSSRRNTWWTSGSASSCKLLLPGSKPGKPHDRRGRWIVFSPATRGEQPRGTPIQTGLRLGESNHSPL